MSNENKKIAVIYPGELLDRIDLYRRTAPGIPDMSNAIRELIELGLEAYMKDLSKED